MAVEKQQNWKAKQDTSERETNVVKTQDSGPKTATKIDMRSDISNVSCSGFSVSSFPVAGFEGDRASARNAHCQTQELFGVSSFPIETEKVSMGTMNRVHSCELPVSSFGEIFDFFSPPEVNISVAGFPCL